MKYFNYGHKISKNMKLLLFLFFIALIVRVLFLLIMPQYFDRMFLFRDDYLYLKYANNLISQGLLIPDIEKLNVVMSDSKNLYNAHILGIGYPIVIALIISLFGENINMLMTINAIFSSATTLLIYLLGKKVYNKNVGLLSAMWSIFYIYFMIYVPRVLKESLLHFLIPLIVLLAIYEIKKYKFNVHSLIFSLVFTFLIHTDERYVIFLPVIIFSIFFLDPNGKINGLKKCSLFFVTFLLLSTPWTVRNFIVYERVIPFSIRSEKVINPIINMAGSLFNASHTSVSPQYSLDELELKNEYDKKTNFNPDRSNNSQPELFISFNNFFKRLSIYWAPMVLRESKFDGMTIPVGSLKYNLGGLLTFGILAPFFIIGSILTIKKNKFGIILISLIILHSLFHIGFDLIPPWPRYRYPIDSFIIIVSFYGFYEIFKDKIQFNNVFKDI